MRTDSGRARRAVLLATGFLVASQLASFQPSAQAQHILVTPPDVKWAPGPASLPPGAQSAILEGDPAKPGLFAMRIKLPDKYRIAPHFHGADEHVTVLQGTFVVGMGEKFDEKAGKELTVGSFAMMPKEMRHFASTRGETIVQIHANGPWTLTYVNPGDDPRNKKPYP
jgi:quercetin dioxygenase-like cupin family protein